MNENTNSSYIIRNISSTYSLACVNMSKILCCYSLCSEVIPQKQNNSVVEGKDLNLSCEP